MKLKRIILITLLLLAIFTIGTVSATDNNATNEVISTENDNEPVNAVNVDEKSSENATDADEILGLNENSNETALTSNNEDDILSLEVADKLGDSGSRKLSAKSVKVYSDKKFTYSVKLTDNNKPVSGKTIELTILDSKYYYKYYSAKTNSKGIATFKLGPQSKGKYLANIEAGNIFDEKYIRVIQNPKTKIAVKAPKVTTYFKANKYFKVAVKRGGKAVKNLKLKVKVFTGKKSKTYKIKTNRKGVAKLSTKKFKIGSHKVKIVSKNRKVKFSKTSKIVIKKKIRYSSFKSPSGYKWKIKTSTWNKMKKQAKKWYKIAKKQRRAVVIGFSNSVNVKVIRGDAAYSAIALAVRNYKGMRCQIRGLPNGFRTSNWGDEW